MSPQAIMTATPLVDAWNKCPTAKSIWKRREILQTGCRIRSGGGSETPHTSRWRKKGQRGRISLGLECVSSDDLTGSD